MSRSDPVGVCALQHLLRLALLLLLGGLACGAMVRLAPGFGASDEDLDSRLSRESQAALRQERTGGESLAAYSLHWLGRMVRGDLGDSELLHAPVRELIAERLPETLKTLSLGLLLAWSLGLACATVSVLFVGGTADRLARAGAMLLLCIPAAVLALLFVMARAPSRLAVGLIVLPKIYQYSRNLLVRTSEMPHVLAARARGAGPGRILVRHLAPVAAPQLLALGGISISLAVAAVVPVEALCDLPGIGQLAWKAALERDVNLLVDLTMLVTVATVAANSVADLAARVLPWTMGGGAA